MGTASRVKVESASVGHNGYSQVLASIAEIKASVDDLRIALRGEKDDGGLIGRVSAHDLYLKQNATWTKVVIIFTLGCLGGLFGLVFNYGRLTEKIERTAQTVEQNSNLINTISANQVTVRHR